MLLDLRTIYAVSAVTSVVLGGVHLLAHATGRFERWPAWWGAGTILIGLGLGFAASRDLVPDRFAIDLANLASVGGYLLLPVAIRAFAGRPLDLRLYGGVALLVLLPLPGLDGIAWRIGYMSVVCGVCDLLVIHAGVGIARRERLYSAWILVGLYVPTVLLFAVRGTLAVTGHLGGPRFLADAGAVHIGLALTIAVFIILRSVTIVLMACERSQNRLIDLAHHDPLTGVMNRAGLAAAFAQAAARDVGGGCAVLVTDIDRFKLLNDTHGHAAGDAELRRFAGLAHVHLRCDDILARQGGDEFVIVLPSIAAADAARLADRIRVAFAAAARPGTQVQPTLSIGVAAGTLGRDDLESLLRRADAALYHAKRTGRDRIGLQPVALHRDGPPFAIADDRSAA